MQAKWNLIFALTLLLISIPFARAEDFIVYSIYRGVDLGNPGEPNLKDYYVNMGSNNGLKKGSSLEVVRKFSTYDLTNQKLYKDVSFPIAKLKIIHVEGSAAIARLDEMMSPDKTPVISPKAVMVGDFVRTPAGR
jgi:hypothetical protein